ncbi:MAG TPA: NUDIX domain-containing protein [Chloroflexi bacterium]|nr:NUDIX domain-containing protein [Chloroflexota bacterium]
MPRTPLQAFIFVLIVVQRDDRFLLVQEASVERGTWFFPAGGVEPGEGLIEAAIREAREEAGVDIVPRSLIWMEDQSYVYEGGLWAGRWRFLLRADLEPSSPQPGPTADSLDARWFTLKEVRALPLRSPEVLDILAEIARGCPELPLDTGYRRRV